MSAYVEVVGRRELAVKIHYWAQEILKADQTCGLGRTPEGRYQVVRPGLIDQWIYLPEAHGQYLGTLSRRSSTGDVEHIPADHSDAESVKGVHGLAERRLPAHARRADGAPSTKA
jgi:hypothetical protein